MMTSPVLFNDVAQAFADGDSSVHAAEAHGCLCGALCVRRSFTLADWLDDVLPDADAQDASSAVLGATYAHTVEALRGADMEFAPLLPDDDEPLAQRVEALSAWCQGFLYGFGAAGSGVRLAMPDDVDEVLADVAQISRAGEVGSESEQIEEGAYAELVEYLRAGTQLVYEELEQRRRAEPATAAPN
jgi:uncharacterized protein YgfB (UPF0149 family)